MIRTVFEGSVGFAFETHQDLFLGMDLVAGVLGFKVSQMNLPAWTTGNSTQMMFINLNDIQVLKKFPFTELDGRLVDRDMVMIDLDDDTESNSEDESESEVNFSPRILDQVFAVEHSSIKRSHRDGCEEQKPEDDVDTSRESNATIDLGTEVDGVTDTIVSSPPNSMFAQVLGHVVGLPITCDIISQQTVSSTATIVTHVGTQKATPRTKIRSSKRSRNRKSPTATY